MEMYISDTHLGHENIVEICRPQFKSVDEMDEAIINNINNRMDRGDLLYIVGDLIYKSKRPPQEYLEAIRPRKILILGNHDSDWLRYLSGEEMAHYFVGVHQQYSLKRNKIELHFDHFPRLAWNRSHYFAQSLAICGHIHDSRESLAARLFPAVPCQFNAGADINGYGPVTLEELVRNNTDFYGRVYTEEESASLEEAVRRLTC